MDGSERIAELVEVLALAGIDVEPQRCDPQALRLTAEQLLELATLLDS
jgi:hypothetical protein